MEKIILNIKNKNKLQFFLQFLKELDFVEIVKPEAKKDSESKHTKEKDFFQFAGIWKGRNVNATELRQKAWRKGS